MNHKDDVDCASLEIDDAYDKFRVPPEFIVKVKAALDEQFPSDPKQEQKMARAEEQLRAIIEKRQHLTIHRTEDAL